VSRGLLRLESCSDEKEQIVLTGPQQQLERGAPVHVVYKDHVAFHHSDPELMAPQRRECLGWLVYECHDYVVVCFDRNADPPTLKGGDPKAGGLVVLQSDVVKLEALR